MDFHLWLAFFAACWAISLSPGPGAVSSMTAGLNWGFWRGYVVVLGLVLGIWVQILIVGVGLGALIAASTLAYGLVKWAGVAYLVYLGVMQWRTPYRPLVAQGEGETEFRPLRLFLRGLWVNVLNPKGTVFLLAVVPQFIDPHDLVRPLWMQYGVIALTLGFTDLVVMAGYTGLAAKVLGALREPHHVRATNRLFGGLFVAAGAFLALFKRGV
jgi:homoserine/homoserine lactone efflux protein